MSYTTQEIHFLDTTIYFNKDYKLESTLYVKPTDICALLHQESFHPKGCKQSVIYSEALQYRRVIPYDETNKLIGPILQKHWHIIEDEESLQELWPRRPILVLKRNKNLRDHLVHTTFTSTHYNTTPQ